MTIVELYDPVYVENIIGAMVCAPERVILIGDDVKKIDRGIARYKKILNSHGIDIELISKQGSKSSLQSVTEAMRGIIEEYGECIFDITGGNEFYLVAVGMLMRDYAGMVQCHKYDFKKGTFSDCDADGYVVNHGEFMLSIEDNITLYGGEIVWESDKGFKTYKWNLNEEFEQDINAMWGVCESDTKLWNSQISSLGELYNIYGDALGIEFNISDAESKMKARKKKFVFVRGFISRLNTLGVIRNLSINGDNVSFEFKNEQCLKCLTVAGQVLELYTAYRMKRIKDDDNDDKLLFDDIMVGVVIDWSDSETDNSIINEIDIIAMRDGVPTFFSCKNGEFGNDELYKLNSVADKFGADYAKKVLVTPNIELVDDKDELVSRMEKMGIRLLNLKKYDGREFEQFVRRI